MENTTHRDKQSIQSTADIFQEIKLHLASLRTCKSGEWWSMQKSNSPLKIYTVIFSKILLILKHIFLLKKRHFCEKVRILLLLLVG